MPVELREEVEDGLAYGESRSERIAELVELGLGVEEALDGAGVSREAMEPLGLTVRLALEAYLEK